MIDKELEAIRQYMKTHPEKFKEHMKQLEKKLESTPKLINKSSNNEISSGFSI